MSVVGSNSQWYDEYLVKLEEKKRLVREWKAAKQARRVACSLDSGADWFPGSKPYALMLFCFCVCFRSSGSRLAAAMVTETAMRATKRARSSAGSHSSSGAFACLQHPFPCHYLAHVWTSSDLGGARREEAAKQEQRNKAEAVARWKVPCAHSGWLWLRTQRVHQADKAAREAAEQEAAAAKKAEGDRERRQQFEEVG